MLMTPLMDSLTIRKFTGGHSKYLSLITYTKTRLMVYDRPLATIVHPGHPAVHLIWFSQELCLQILCFVRQLLVLYKKY